MNASSEKQTIKCPCGSLDNYNDCCKPIHNDRQLAKSACQLMRARYSAYALASKQQFDSASLISFLLNSQSALHQSDNSAKEIEDFANATHWQSLRIIDRKSGGDADKHGVVEFIALYTCKGVQSVLHEVSNFERDNTGWQYTNGKILPTGYEQAQVLTCKLKRNDPCWCDSGNKYKKCHG